jgi:hypothetical protein
MILGSFKYLEVILRIIFLILKIIDFFLIVLVFNYIFYGFIIILTIMIFFNIL